MQKLSLVLFFTKGVCLNQWQKSGLLYREKLLYEKMLNEKAISECYFVTYGSKDYQIIEKLKIKNEIHESIHILHMPFVFKYWIGQWVYSIICVLIHYKAFKQASLFKTNQMNGAWAAVLAKIILRKPLYLRCGYLLSQLEKAVNPDKKIKNYIIKFIESISYKYADIISVSSKHNYEYLAEFYPRIKEKIKVMPTYVNTSSFKPKNIEKFKDRILVIGRLSKEKNMDNLIRAVKGLNIVLDVYGDGDCKENLVELSNSEDVTVNFFERVPNNSLPEIINQYKYYVLCSLSEGTPKTLLECMACGLICIGTDVTGINEIIKDKYNGFLAKTVSAEDIRFAIIEAMTYSNKKAISESAIKTIKSNYSLERYSQKEAKIIKSLVS
jgi:glycosyltransferase involved in cell wall biosynthesis